jgi:PAS domain S-box-containing protein
VAVAAAADLLVSWHVGRKPFLAASFMLGDAFEALLAASLIQAAARGRPRMWRLRDLLAVIVLGAVLAPIVPALLGAASTHLANQVPFDRAWAEWWAGDGLGILVITPLLLAWSSPRGADRNPVVARPVEFTTLVAATLATSWAVFRQAQRGVLAEEHLVLPVFVWAALRFGPRGVTAASALLAVAAGWATAWASAASGTQALAPDSSSVQGYLALAIATSLLLATEVAARERTEDELRLARYALDRGGEAFLVADARGAVVLASEAAGRLLGQDPAALVGRHIGDLDPALSGPAWRARWAELRAHGSWRHESTLRDASGRGPPGEVNLAFLSLDGAEFLAWSARDLSERRRAEEEQRLAAVGTLAAGMAHEINNPLTYVTSNLAYVEETLASMRGLHPDVGEAESAVAEATLGARRVRDIVRDLRFVARPPDGRRTEVDPVQEIRSALTLAQAEIARRARLDVRLAPCPPVLAGQGQIGQVMLHLFVNAAQAIPLGAAGSHVVQVVSATDPEGWATIEVTDSGPGGAGATAGAGARPVGSGAGMGLSVCRGIVTGLGGTLDVLADVERGTRVRVRLPPAGTAGAPARS